MTIGRGGDGRNGMNEGSVDTKSLLGQNKESMTYHSEKRKQSQRKSRHHELSHVKEPEPLTEHDIKINEQVNKVLERVKHI